MSRPSPTRIGGVAAALGCAAMVGLAGAGNAGAAPADRTVSSPASDPGATTAPRRAAPAPSASARISAPAGAAAVRRPGWTPPGVVAKPPTPIPPIPPPKPKPAPTPDIGTTTGAVVPAPPATYPVTFNVDYGNSSSGWTPAARAALESAAKSLGSYFEVAKPVTITLSVSSIDPATSNALGYASVGLTSGANGFFPTVVQQKIQTSVDSNGSTADASIAVNFAYDWAFGDSIGFSQFDFKAVAIHELLHAMGFMTGSEDPARLNKNWMTFDKFLSTKAGKRVIDTRSFTVDTAYLRNFTGGNDGLYFTGPNVLALTGTNGVPLFPNGIKLYTPNSWLAGGSVSHLDPQPGYVMKPAYSTGPANRLLSPVEIAVLRDLGYTVRDVPLYFAVLLVFLRRRRR